MSKSIPEQMAGVQLIGHGGYDQLVYRTDIPTPHPAAGEVLMRVGACGVNNTDVNTRIGWYSKEVTDGTNSGGEGFDRINADDAAWGGWPLELPRIQGADGAGHIVAVGDGVDVGRIGQRVMRRAMAPIRDSDAPMACFTYGSERDGAFAQYATAVSEDALVVNSSWTDAELASMPCAASTAEGMLDRVSVGAERVLITGASGGVGAACVQLAKRRGAHVIAISGAAKVDAVRELGADEVFDRDADLMAELGANSVDAALDVVAGPGFGTLLDLLRPGGRYGTVGAIAAPIVDLDVRTLYLKDLSMFGSTFQRDEIFENLIRYIEADDIKPTVAMTFPLEEIVAAQQAFLEKKHVGKIVLIPPA